MAVDFTGQTVEVEEIRRICDEFNLVFIEDVAHSIGSKYNGAQVGSLADLTTLAAGKDCYRRRGWCYPN